MEPYIVFPGPGPLLSLRSVKLLEQTGAVRKVTQIPLGSFCGTDTGRESANCFFSSTPYGECCVDCSNLYGHP